MKRSYIFHKGAGSVMPDLISDVVSMVFPNLPIALPQVQSGKLWALGVTIAVCSSAEPTLPTLAKAGVPNYDMSTCSGPVGPPRMPPEIVARLLKDAKIKAE